MPFNGDDDNLPELEQDEVRHRLRAYLQNMTSLISLQIRRARHPEAVRALEDLGARFATIIGIHVHLDDASEEPIAIDVFLARFVRTIAEHYDAASQHNLSIDIAPVMLDGQRAVLLGQIIVELLINAYRHALSERTGAIEVALVALGNHAVLTIADDGPGLPQLAGDHPQFGFSTVAALAKALDGTFDYENRAGFLARVRFPIGS